MQHQVVVVDDHALVRDGIRQLLVGEFRIVGEASSGAEARLICQTFACDLILLDSYLPGEDIDLTLRHLKDIRSRLPPIVLLLSHGQDDYTLSRALQAGVKGFVQKSDRSAILLEAIRTVVAGGTYISASNGARLARLLHRGERPTVELVGPYLPLSPRQEAVLRWIVRGKQNKEIASLLGLSEHTVKLHRKRMMHKLRVGCVAELLQVAYRERLTVPDLELA